MKSYDTICHEQQKLQNRYKQKKTHNGWKNKFWILPAFRHKQISKLKTGIITFINSHLCNSDLFIIINLKKIKTQQWKNNKAEYWSISDTWTFLEITAPKCMRLKWKSSRQAWKNCSMKSYIISFYWIKSCFTLTIIPTREYNLNKISLMYLFCWCNSLQNIIWVQVMAEQENFVIHAKETTLWELQQKSNSKLLHAFW